MMKVARKFYVGHSKLAGEVMTGVSAKGAFGPTYTHVTLAEAVAQAEDKCRDTGEDQIVVQVVRIVRRAPQPVRVEVVK